MNAALNYMLALVLSIASGVLVVAALAVVVEVCEQRGRR